MTQIEKWMMVLFGLLIICMFSGVYLSESLNHNCRIELAKANRSVEDITKICK